MFLLILLFINSLKIKAGPIQHTQYFQALNVLVKRKTIDQNSWQALFPVYLKHCNHCFLSRKAGIIDTAHAVNSNLCDKLEF